MTHSEFTRDANGNFKHPFLNSAPEVQTIHYPKTGSFSTKLHKVKGPSRHTKRKNGGINISDRTLVSDQSTWGSLMKYLFPSYGVTFTTTTENDNNLNYVGQVFIGTPQQQYWVVYDTGSGAFLLRTSDCPECTGDWFVIPDSSTFAYNDPDEPKSEEY